MQNILFHIMNYTQGKLIILTHKELLIRVFWEYDAEPFIDT